MRGGHLGPLGMLLHVLSANWRLSLLVTETAHCAVLFIFYFLFLFFISGSACTMEFYGVVLVVVTLPCSFLLR